MTFKIRGEPIQLLADFRNGFEVLTLFLTGLGDRISRARLHFKTAAVVERSKRFRDQTAQVMSPGEGKDEGINHSIGKAGKSNHTPLPCHRKGVPEHQAHHNDCEDPLKDHARWVFGSADGVHHKPADRSPKSNQNE